MLNIPDKTIKSMINYLEEKFPEEGCGIISNDIFIPFPNLSKEPEESFLIQHNDFYRLQEQEKIQWLVHSHNNNFNATRMDQDSQDNLQIPFLVINLKYGKYDDYFHFGSKFQVPFIGRKFCFGVWDCLSLVRDYCKRNYRFKLPNPSREIGFVERGEKLFEKYIQEEIDNFDIIKKEDIEPGDLLLYGSRNQINHVGILVAENKCLHHWQNRLSDYFPLDYHLNYLAYGLRRKV
jgi:proteasome lid subunit RPN8/RPN11